MFFLNSLGVLPDQVGANQVSAGQANARPNQVNKQKSTGVFQTAIEQL
ncbi:MAG: hypothetical protein HPY71_09605 [Firmicutes bacterium]|nr:hypothetical protein [Bacillota bacterium]